MHRGIHPDATALLVRGTLPVAAALVVNAWSQGGRILDSPLVPNCQEEVPTGQASAFAGVMVS